MSLVQNPWGGLGAAFRRSIGMEPPNNAYRMARAAGYTLVPIDSAVCVALIGREILFDDRECVGRRQKHAAIARALAAAVLKHDGFPTTPLSIEEVARDMMLPTGEELACALEACDHELEQIEQTVCLHVPGEWLADAVERLLPCNVVQILASPRARQ